MLPILQIGPLAIQTPGLVLIAGYWLALELAARQGSRQGLDGDAIQNAGFYGALAGLLAARLGHVVQHWPVYRENLRGVLSLNPQTLSPFVGLTAGCLVAAAFLQRRKLPLRSLLDAIAPSMAVLAAAMALANLLSGAAFGIETQVPWSIELWGARRQPVQIYELGAGLLILGILLWSSRQAPKEVSAPVSGLRFLLFVALYGGARTILEPLRATSHFLSGGLRTAQVVGLVGVLVATVLARAWSSGVLNQAHPGESPAADPPADPPGSSIAS